MAQGCDAKLRQDGDKPYVTDNDNYIVDLYFNEPIKDAYKAGKEVRSVLLVVHEACCWSFMKHVVCLLDYECNNVASHVSLSRQKRGGSTHRSAL